MLVWNGEDGGHADIHIPLLVLLFLGGRRKLTDTLRNKCRNALAIIGSIKELVANPQQLFVVAAKQTRSIYSLHFLVLCLELHVIINHYASQPTVRTQTLPER